VIAGHTVRFEHDEGGREISRTVDGGVSFTQSFDADDNLVGQSVQAAGAPPRHRRFSYRQDGLLTGIDDDAAGRTRLVLDATGRVVETHSATGSETFRYDPAGNVLEAHEPGYVPSAGARRYVGNRLVSAGTVSFEHDAQGRVTARTEGGRVWKYRWDSQDRLLAVTTPEGEQWQYRYDPIGRRIAKQRMTASSTGAPVAAESYEFTWSGALLVEQVYVDPAQTRHVTVWAHHPDDDRPIVQVERSATMDERFFAIVTDLIGRPTDLVDAAGSPVWHGNAGLWGREDGAAATPLRFPGQYADAESGLHYNVYRYYDPSTGRYLSQDPLGLGPAPNPAAYVGNPLADRDLLGLACGKKGQGGNNTTNDRPGGGNNAGNIPRKILNWFRKPFKKKPAETPAAPPPHTDPNPPPPPKSDGRYENNQRPMLDKYESETDPAKEPFPGQSVQRLNDQQREEHRVYIDGSGNMRNAKDGTLFDTSNATDIHHGSGDGRAIFTMDKHGNIYASNYQGAGDFHHSTLANGQPVAAAGELTVKNGNVTHVNNNSGHYQPQITHSENINNELKSHGINPPVYGFGGMQLNGPNGVI
jgi:RHS repeat-associated protein